MSSSVASAQGHGGPVAAEPELEVLLPLVTSSKASEKDHGVPLLVPVPVSEPQAPAAGAEDYMRLRLERRRRREMVRLNRLASSEGSKRARRPESGTISGSPAAGWSAKVAPEPPQQQGAAAAAVVWPRSLSHGVHSVIGRRQAMEDTVDVAAPLLPVVAAAGEGEEKTGERGKEEEEEGDDGWIPDFFAVYDGHGGAWVAETCRDRLHVVLAEEMARLRLANGGGEAGGALWREAMLAAFARVDGEVAAIQIARKDGPPHAEGSAAVVVVVEPRRIVVANCGDSRAVLCRGGVAVPLSADHKPERPDELARIESVGGQVIYWQGPRVQGVLAMSRSIGDYFMKPSISAEPEVTVTDRTGTDEFIILGSDGLWDAMSNQYACRVVRYCLSGRLAAKYPATVHGSSATDAAKLLADLAMARGSEDNVSVVVVQLRRMVWRRKHQAARQNGRSRT